MIVVSPPPVADFLVYAIGYDSTTFAAGPLAGRTVTLAEATNSPQVTDAAGLATLTAVPLNEPPNPVTVTLSGSGESVSILASRTGYYPGVGSLTGTGYSVVLDDATGWQVQFTVTDPVPPPPPPAVSLSGTVTNASGGAPISGKTVTLSGANTGSTSTDGSGNYSFTGLSSGSTTVSVSLVGPETAEHKFDGGAWTAGGAPSLSLSGAHDLDFRISGVVIGGGGD